MKKIKKSALVVLGLLFALSGKTQNAGQNGLLRPAVDPPANGTGAAVRWVQIATPSVATTTDTFYLLPSGGVNIVQPSDSLLQKAIYVIQTKQVNYVGDELTFIIATSKKKAKDTVDFRNKYNMSFKFSNPADSTITVIGGKSIYVKFINDGTYWRETVKDTIAR